MYLTAANIIDIVLAVFFLLAVVRGWYTGLAMQAAHLAVLLASIAIAYILSHMLGIIPLFGVFFIIAMAILNQAVKAVKIVSWIPVVGTINKAGGAAVGFLIAFFACFLLLRFLFGTVPQELWQRMGLWQEAIDRTYLLKAFIL